jgi:putative flippase GtrA
MDRFSAAAVATIVATALSFVASRYWTFRHRKRSDARRETVLFFTVNGIGVAISEGCVGLASAIGLTGKLSYNLALNGGIALATLFRYWSYRTWVWPAAAAASGPEGPPPGAATAHPRLIELPVRELARFGVVGAFAFSVTEGCSFLLHSGAGAGPLTSVLAAVVAAMAVSYAGNRCWTFRHRQRPGVRRESLRYTALYGTGLAIKLSCIAFTVYVLGQHSTVAYLAALVTGAGLGTAILFWSCREWVWPARRPMPAAAWPVPS